MENPDDPSPGREASFDDLALDPRLAAALGALGYEEPTPIQNEAIPPLLDGRDVIGRARTGSGKTAAFGIPLLTRVLDGGPPVRGLVLAPTRELALQVTEALRELAKKLPIRIVTIYGGASYRPQLAALREGVPIVVGTPGRTLDHMARGTLDLSQVQMVVLDEADEMLRMGFLEDVTKVLDATPPGRQVALFSATMPPPIRAVAQKHLREPIEVQVERRALTTAHIVQRALVVPERHKIDALVRVLAAEDRGTTLVFARTRAGCAEAADRLAARGVGADALHGDLNQGARERVLARLRSGRLDVVVATDVAARGIDIEHVTHVVNLDLPTDPESYVHRIGRTGRAGREGVAISLVTPAEMSRVGRYQRLLDVTIERVEVPSDADVRRRQVERLKKDVVTAGDALPAPLAALLDELGELGPRAVAAGALALLARERGLDLEGEADESPPSWSRPKPRPERSPRPDPDPGAPPDDDEVEIFLPMGKARGVRAGDVVGALTNELGLRGSDIGRVTILPHKSFVRVKREAAARLLRDQRYLTLRGTEVPLVRARPRAPSADDRGRKGRGFKHGHRRGPPPRRTKRRGDK